MTSGALLLAAYAAGLAVPFAVLGLLLPRWPGLPRLARWHRPLRAARGLLLVVLGLMLYTNTFARLAAWFGGWWL